MDVNEWVTADELLGTTFPRFGTVTAVFAARAGEA